MTPELYDLIARSLDGPLSAADQARLDGLLADSPGYRLERTRMEQMHRILREATALTVDQAIRPFFTDRVMRRLSERTVEVVREAEFARDLVWLFRRVALTGLVIAASLAAFNASRIFPHAQQSALEVVLALPPVTIDQAYDIDPAVNP